MDTLEYECGDRMPIKPVKQRKRSFAEKLPDRVIKNMLEEVVE